MRASALPACVQIVTRGRGVSLAVAGERGARRSPATRRKRGSGGRAVRDVDIVAVGVVFSEAGRVRS